MAVIISVQRRDGPSRSIFLWQQNRGRVAICFRDDPNCGSAIKSVSREQPEAVDETEFVFTVIVLVHISPVSGDVSGEISERSFA